MQEAQNIFDDPVFFYSYMELRSEENFNDLLEQPSMGALLPPLEGRRVLDIGCGFGRNCMDFVQRGASEVLGIDISSKMLNIAMKENPAPEIEYRRLAMEDLSTLEGGFDLIYSSLAFHYALDFPRLMRDCHDLLVDGGILLFSQEHPIATASRNTDNRYVKDDEGNVFFKVADYPSEGERHVRWFVDDVVHQHRTVSTLVNAMCDAGFTIVRCVEPSPDRRAIRRLEGLRRDLVKPSFIIFKARKGV